MQVSSALRKENAGAAFLLVLVFYSHGTSWILIVNGIF